MRQWWIDSIHAISRFGGDFPYEYCGLNTPSSMFVDRTIPLSLFEDDLDSGDQSRLMNALANEEVNISNILCPFGCTDRCRKAEYAEWDLIIQRYLLKTPLKIDSKRADRHRFYHAMSEQYFRDEGDYDHVELNPEWAIMPTIILSVDGPQVLTCRHHGRGDDHHRLYPPRPPHHDLSATRTDQLSHVTIKPRIAQPTFTSVSNTRYSMTTLHGNFTGMDTMNICTHSNWSFTSELMAYHESLQLHGRDDHTHLLAQKVARGQMSQELADNMLSESRHRFPDGSITRYIQGSTFVTLIDIISIQLHQSQEECDDGGLIEAINDGDETVDCRRGWPRRINIIQMEDMHGYGYQFRPVPQLASGKSPMMTWTMVSILSGVKELWEAVDSKLGVWRYDSWEGHMLTFIRQNLFQFETIWTDGRSPFKPWCVKSFVRAEQIINRHAPMDFEEDPNDPALAYKFSFEFMASLFPQAEYPTIFLSESVEDAISTPESQIELTNIIVVVQSSKPEFYGNCEEGINSDRLIFDDGSSFELRSIVLHQVDFVPAQYASIKPNDFKSVRYIRHGSGYDAWWSQERSNKIVTQHTGDVVRNLVEDETITLLLHVY